jgi:hypothetical protein
VSAATSPRAVPATSLRLPRGDDLELIIEVDTANGFIRAAIDRPNSIEPSLAAVLSGDARLRSGPMYAPTYACLFVGTAMFHLRPPEVDAVRDLFHAHCIAFDDARETT